MTRIRFSFVPRLRGALLAALAGVGVLAALVVPAGAVAVDPPAAVTGLSVQAGDAPGELYVSWDSHPEGADDYRVSWARVGRNFKTFRNTNWNAFPVDNELTISGLQPGDSYKVKVRARFDGPNARWSPVVTGTAAAETTTPTEKKAPEPDRDDTDDIQPRGHNNPPWQDHGDLIDIEKNLKMTFRPSKVEFWYKLDSLAAGSVHYIVQIHSKAGDLRFEIYNSGGEPVMLNGRAVGNKKYLYFMPETAGDYRLRVYSTSNDSGYAFVQYRDETPGSSKGDVSGRDCTGNKYVHINDCLISGPDTTVAGREHQLGQRKQTMSGQADQDYDVYELFLRRGTRYRVCIDSVVSGYVALWVNGLGHYGSASKSSYTGGTVCTTVVPRVTGAHFLSTRVGELHTTDANNIRAPHPKFLSVSVYSVWYELA